MAMVPYPPTNVAFLAQCAKPEAFTGNPSASPPVPGIPLATIDAVLRRCADEAANVALSDRSTPPLLMVDEGFQGWVFDLTARVLMRDRNFNPKAGADSEIIVNAERADKMLAACGPGNGGKRITPLFVDSFNNAVQDSIRVSSHARADWWAQTARGTRTSEQGGRRW